jgi:4-amino-4-deoxy-L-arabinose transferase-like glycosyltransferase
MCSVVGDADDVTARWPRWAVAALLIGTAALYLWNLSVCGYGNSFYAAAAQAGAKSWSAWFFGALDARDFITVDKPPAALWVTGLSVRLFGLSSWSVLAPQAVMGVAAVAVLFATVRRTFADPMQGTAAGLIAGAVLACTPAAALMFRFNNPDALLVLLLTVAAYSLTRAVATASWRWLALVGLVMGTAFLTKMLQCAVVLPGFAAAYLMLAPADWQKRLLHMAIGGLSLIVAAGWWVLAVALVPAESRPYVGGSTDDSVLNLAFGYNGVSRIVGNGGARTWGGPAGHGADPTAGLHRLFSAELGYEISWLLPVALFAVAFGGYLALRRKISRDEGAALVMWGGWLLVTGVIFSVMDGTVHPYYSVALAPAVAALVAVGGVWAWRCLPGWTGRVALAIMALLAGFWSAILLQRNDFGPSWLPWAVVGIAVGAASTVLVGQRLATRIALAAGMLSAVAGTALYTLATAATPHQGSVPIAVSSMRGVPVHTVMHEAMAVKLAVGGWTGDVATNHELAELLAATSTPWSAATNGSQSAAVLELASGTSVMAIGGWSGDPVPTLKQFTDDVAAGKVTYYVEAGVVRPRAKVFSPESETGSCARQIADWVAAHYDPVPVGQSLVFRLR